MLILSSYWQMGLATAGLLLLIVAFEPICTPLSTLSLGVLVGSEVRIENLVVREFLS